MMIDASCVTIKQRMWIEAEGGAGPDDEEGGADVVEDGFPASSDRVRDSSRRWSDEVPLGEGVDAVVSATDAGGSVMFTS
jgi:hypothetical protein